MRRREFIAFVSSTAVAWPLTARAQQPNTPLVGFINVQSSNGYRPMAAAFRQGLQETGYVEGQNVAIEYRWAEGQSDRLPAMVADLIHRRVAVIAATSTPAALTAKAATKTIPIVFETGGDPIKLGLVASLNRPGGNVTGVGFLLNDLAPKRLELLHELVPSATAIGLLSNPTSPLSQSEASDVQAAARVLGLRVHVENASSERDIDAAFASLVRQRVNALFVGADAFFQNRRDQLVALAARHALPASYGLPEVAAAGGLMSYGPSQTDVYRQVGVYTGRVLKGEKPGETKFELIIANVTAPVFWPLEWGCR
jgi:putative tryptophan/tyrosine transport system substrate-binding protein